MKQRILGITLLSLALALTLTAAPSTSEAVPGQLNYQGLLRDNVGTPLDGLYNFQFFIYPDSTGGSACWGPETYLDVVVDKGLFDLRLGSQIPIPAGCFDGGVKWLQIWVNGAPLTPRRPIASAAYALVSDGGGGGGSVDSVRAGAGLVGVDEGGPVVQMSVGAGTGIIANSDDIEVDLTLLDGRYVQESQPNSINSPMILNGSITSSDLGFSSVGNLELQDNSISASKILDGVIMTSKIADGAITEAKLAPGVGLGGDVDSVVAGAGLAGVDEGGPVVQLSVGAGMGIVANPDNIAVDQTYLDGQYVGEGQVGSVDSPMIQDNSVTSDDLAVGSVGSSELQGNSVSTSKITDASIITSKIADAAISTPKIADQSITQAKLAPGVGVGGDVDSVVAGAGMVGVDEGGPVVQVSVGAGTGIIANANDIAVDQTYLDGQYVAENQADAINSPMILDGSVTVDDLGFASVGNLELQDNSVSGSKIIDGVVGATKIADAAISTTKIAAAAVTDAELAAGSVTNSKIQDAAVTTAKIQDASVTEAKLAPGVGAGLQRLGSATVPQNTESTTMVLLGEVGVTGGDVDSYVLILARVSGSHSLSGIQTAGGNDLSADFEVRIFDGSTESALTGVIHVYEGIDFPNPGTLPFDSWSGESGYTFFYAPSSLEMANGFNVRLYGKTSTSGAANGQVQLEDLTVMGQ